MENEKEMSPHGGWEHDEQSHVKKSADGMSCKHCGSEVDHDGFATSMMSEGGEVEESDVVDYDDGDEKGQEKSRDALHDNGFAAAIRRRMK